MNAEEQHFINCPYCGETINIIVDYSDINQDYIEDCQVCCRPINIHVNYGENHSVKLHVTHENE